MSIVYSPRMMK